MSVWRIAPFLDVGAGPDHDGLAVAADDRPEPDTDVGAEIDVTDDVSVGCDPDPIGCRKARLVPSKRIDRHAPRSPLRQFPRQARLAGDPPSLMR